MLCSSRFCTPFAWDDLERRDTIRPGLHEATDAQWRYVNKSMTLHEGGRRQWPKPMSTPNASKRRPCSPAGTLVALDTPRVGRRANSTRIACEISNIQTLKLNFKSAVRNEGSASRVKARTKSVRARRGCNKRLPNVSARLEYVTDSRLAIGINYNYTIIML